MIAWHSMELVFARRRIHFVKISAKIAFCRDLGIRCLQLNAAMSDAVPAPSFDAVGVFATLHIMWGLLTMLFLAARDCSGTE